MRSASSSSTKCTNCHCKQKTNVPPEPYQLALNIALAHNASLEVLQVLVQADPSQVMQRDGIHGVNSLCLALEKRPNDTGLLGLLLVSAGPQLVRQPCDNLANTPLHVACQRGSAPPIVRHLYQLYPPALRERNASGKTPLDLLESQAAFSDRAKECWDFFQTMQEQR